VKKENFEFARYIKNENDARWADPEEFTQETNSLFPSVTKINVETEDCPVGGIPIISDGSTAYVDGSDTHTMIFGATGSKKTRLFAMPLINMLALAGESFIATDPKGELYDKTSGLVAAKGYKTIVLNFRDLKKSDYWNPLDLPHQAYHNGETDDAIAMINDFVNAISEPQSKNTKDIYFVVLGCAQLLASLLFFVATASSEENSIFNFIEAFIEKSSPEGTRELFECTADSSVAAVNFKLALTNEKVEKTFANVVSTVAVSLNPFLIRKSLCQLLSKSSFDIHDFCKTKIAVYILVPDEKTTLHFLVTSFIKQVYETLISDAQKQDNKKLPIRVNFLLDEFCNIPTIPDMPSMITAARSRNMRFFLIAQSLFQLQQKYGDDAKTIVGNCDNLIFLTSREKALLEEISFLCGTTTKGPLISTSELQRLKKDIGEALILHDRNYPFVTELPDIDEYKFKKYPTQKLENRPLPKIEKYNIEKVISEIKTGKRPLPFSQEVYGEEKMYAKSKAEEKKSDLFDW